MLYIGEKIKPSSIHSDQSIYTLSSTMNHLIQSCLARRSNTQSFDEYFIKLEKLARMPTVDLDTDDLMCIHGVVKDILKTGKRIDTHTHTSLAFLGH